MRASIRACRWGGRAIRVAVAAAAALGGASLAVAPASAGGCCANVYVHYSTAADTAWNFTNLDLPAQYVSQTHGQPSAWALVTPSWDPGGVWQNADNHTIGVWYNPGAQDWSIFNEDGSAMPQAAAFNVYAIGGNPTGPLVFVTTATSANSAADYTDFSNPIADGNPNATVFVTPNWNPGGNGGTYDASPIGVWYNAGTGHWSIFDEDLSAVPNGASFNVYVAYANTNGVFVQTADWTNTSGNYTCINSPSLNGNPDAVVNVTPNWNPGNSAGVYDNAPLAVAYLSGRWCIVNSNGTAMPVGASFNVLAGAGQLQHA
jgi:hypothetical protein